MIERKYAIPEVSDVVERERLFSFLDENNNRSLFFILGQAAQGKSTLIASYLSLPQNQNQSKTLWLHLTKKESDHTKFFYMLYNALSIVIEDNALIKILKIPQTTLGVGEDVDRYGEILSSLFDGVDKKINIVLDDMESLDDNASALFLIQFIIKRIPSNISFFLLSRQMPHLSIEKLKMGKKVVVLNNEDLKFNLDETREFFIKFEKTGKIDFSLIKKIQVITEGWAGGLTLVSESIRTSPDLNKLPEHITKDVFSFFSEEIYFPLPEGIKNFLRKTSLFEVLDPEVLSIFCKDIPDPVQILIELEKRNLFIQKIDSSGKLPVFRYNKLFKTFLNQALLNDTTEDQLKRHNIEAGRIFQENKEHEQAIQYFIDAQSYNDIARTIKILGTDFVIRGRFTALDKWIESLPDEIIFKDPWLIFYLTITRRIKGGEQNINDFQIALSLFEDLNDLRGQILSVAYLIEASVFMRKPFHVILKFINKGKGLLDALEDNVWFTWARTLLWQQTGFGYIAGNGDILKGISSCQNAIVLAGKIDNIDLKLNASIIMILGYVQAGDFINAQIVLSKIQNLTQEGMHPEYRVLKNLVNIDFALKKGNFKSAETLLLKVEADIEKFGFLFLYPGFVEAKSMCFIYSKEYKEANRTAEHLSDFSTLEGNDFYKGIAHGIKAVSLYHQAEYKMSENNAVKALKIMEKTKRSDIHLFRVRQVLGFALFHQKKFKQAQKEFQLCLNYFEIASSNLSYAETNLGLGLLMHKQAREDEAEKYITQGIKRAAKEKYLHFNVMSVNDFIRALLLARIYQDHDKQDFSEYVFESLSSNSKFILPGIDSVLSLKSKKKRADEIEKLRDVHKIALPAMRIKTLGGFKIFKNKKEIKNINFEGTKPKLLLKAIVFHGGKAIPKDVLIEDIWPESNAKAGEKNFKINLHRLRKALEPTVNQMFGYSYLIHKGGLISFDIDLVSIDTDEFLKFVLQGKTEEHNNKKDKAIEFYDKAISLYKGDYFVEEPYVEWLSAKRDLFRIKYIEVLQKKALLHKKASQIDMAAAALQKILQADPLFERAYQELMIIYADSGMKNKAINTFKACENIFKQELDIDPDYETVKIYNLIRENKKLIMS